MSKPNEGWSWWVGHDDERFHTECDTREEAVRIATEEQDGGYICEAKQNQNVRLSSYFDASDFLERVEEDAYDDLGDPEGDTIVFDVTPEHQKDLENRIRSAIEDWQNDNGLRFRSWRFSAQRNEEFIDVPEEELDEIEEATE